jgi:hypothetical protein
VDSRERIPGGEILLLRVMGEAVIPSLGLPIGAMAAILNGILLRQSWRDGAFAAPTAEEAERNAPSGQAS